MKEVENVKEEKKIVNISLGAFVFLFIVLVIIVAIVGFWSVYNNITF